MWTVPAKRMKSNREHRVPLCGRALEILDEARTLVEGASPFLFPIGSASSSKRSNCAGCSRSTGSRPCHTVFAQASGTGRPRRRTIRARSSKRPLAHVFQKQGRGSLSAHGPIRPPTSAHGRLGGVSSRREYQGGTRVMHGRWVTNGVHLPSSRSRSYFSRQLAPAQLAPTSACSLASWP